MAAPASGRSYPRTRRPSAPTSASSPGSHAQDHASGDRKVAHQIGERQQHRRSHEHPAESEWVVFAERRKQREGEHRAREGPGQREEGFDRTAKLPRPPPPDERAGDERERDRRDGAPGRHPQRIHQRAQPLGLAEQAPVVHEREHRRQGLGRPAAIGDERHEDERQMRQQEYDREDPTGRRRGAVPLPSAVRMSSPSVRRSSAKPRMATSASATVSTMARDSSPLSLVATICVVITRKPPPNTYGALNEPRAVMNTSNAAPASAGRSSGSVTRRSVSQRPTPSASAASSIEASSLASPARVNR